MSRPAVEVADILRAQGPRFLQRHRRQLSFQQLKVMRVMPQTVYYCSRESSRRATIPAGFRPQKSSRAAKILGNSSTRSQSRGRWDKLQLVLGGVPEAAGQAGGLSYPAAQAVAPETEALLIEVAADPRHLGAKIGFCSVLHTWGQNLQLHPHVHGVIPAGGLAPDHSRWIRPRYPFFLPVKVLSRVFRGKSIAGLRRAFQRNQLRFGGELASLGTPQRFAAFLRTLFRHDWVVYAKPAFGGPGELLRYLGRYTHRGASCASATSDSWPTAIARSCCRCADNGWRWHPWSAPPAPSQASL